MQLKVKENKYERAHLIISGGLQIRSFILISNVLKIQITSVKMYLKYEK